MAEKEKNTEVLSGEVENTSLVDVEEDTEVRMVITLKKPYHFEGKDYTEIDLNGLDDLRASDMIAVNKYMQRTTAGIDVMPEVSLEYACVLASKAAKLPIEFFTGLPPKEAMKVKNRVMGFLFGSD